MADQQRVPPSRLAGLHNALGEVLPCRCGGVRLGLGSLSLHFAAEEVVPLRELVAAASELAAVVAPAREPPRKPRRPRRARCAPTLH